MENHDPIKSITPGQVGKVQELIGAALRKSDLQSEPSQQVLENQGTQVINEMVAVFRKYVEAISSMILRHIVVNRTRSPQEAINATGRNKYLTDDVVASMPQGNGNEADVFFFKLGRDISDADLEKEYEMRGLKPADPYALAAANEADPAFADDHPNCTHWKDENGNWCYSAFGRWDGKRNVGVDRDDYDWRDYWWFAGCRK